MSLYRFEWVIEGELAAMAMPDGYEEDWRELRRLGVGAVVNLTLRGFYMEDPEKYGLASLHLPIADFEAPEPQQVDRFLEFCDEQMAAGRPVVVHCVAGRGRTGTMLACYMVRKGMDPDEAVSWVRRIREGAVENSEQMDAVRAYALRRQAEEP